MSPAEQLRKYLTELQGRAKISDEKAVKRLVRRAFDKGNIFSFMPPAHAFGCSGISDILVVHQGRFAAIETKYGYNKPTAQQLAFGESVTKAGGCFVVINERNFVDEMTRVFLYLFHEIDLWAEVRSE